MLDVRLAHGRNKFVVGSWYMIRILFEVIIYDLFLLNFIWLWIFIIICFGPQRTNDQLNRTRDVVFDNMSAINIWIRRRKNINQLES
jgi:hypothetical protein